MSTSRLLYNSRITKVKFFLSGSDTVLNDSYARITSYDLFRNNLPYPGGVYDAHLGTTDHSYRCQTCFNNKKNCLGHEGHVELNYPVINPMAVNDLRRWIKLICFRCGHPVIEDSAYNKFPRGKRLDEASKIARTGSRKCHHCKKPHPTVKKDPKEPLALLAEWFEDKRKVDEEKLYPHRIKEIFSRVTDETVIKLGKHVSSHPRNFILDKIKVSPTPIRPDVKKIGGGRSTNDDLTTMTQIIIKKNEAIPPVVPANIEPKLEKAIFELCNAYYDLIKAGGDGAMNSIALRLRGKQGRFRKTQMGKRVRNMCRSTITGDPTLKINQVGVPMTFAKNIQYDEVVQEYNKKQLMVYVNNGRTKYPGCTKVIKKSTGAEYGVESLKDIELENGDIIHRDMINNDPVNFNRQPSLMASNITTLFAVVCEDPSILTLRMNVLLCPFKQMLTCIEGRQQVAAQIVGQILFGVNGVNLTGLCAPCA